MPEKHEVMLWAAIGQKYSNGRTFSQLLAPNVKYLRGDLIVESPFQLIWKSYGKRVVIEVIGSNSTQLITVSLSQFGQVSLTLVLRCSNLSMKGCTITCELRY